MSHYRRQAPTIESAHQIRPWVTTHVSDAKMAATSQKYSEIETKRYNIDIGWTWIK
jgi:hypothetical protein